MPKVLAPLWAVALVLGLLTASLPQPPHRVAHVLIPQGGHPPLWVFVFAPDTPRYERAPAAVICQPVNNGPDHARPLALELVNQGFVVLAFDWRGRSEGENRQTLRSDLHGVLLRDGLAAVQYLRSRPDVEPKRIVIAGHSVGGNMAINVALAASAAAGGPIAATACIGMETDVPPGRPRNLLWAAGLYDEFRTPSAMRAAFERSASGPIPKQATVVGDFAEGSARGLALSPTADHFTELLDRRLQKDVIKWFCAATSTPYAPDPMWAEWRGRTYAATWIAFLVAEIATLRSLLAGRPRRLRAVPLAGLFLVTVFTAWGKAHPFLSADVVVGMLLGVPLAAYVCGRDTTELGRGLRKALRIATTLWAALLLTLVINRAPDLFRKPSLLLFLPEFGIGHLLDMFYAYLVVYMRQLAFAAYGPGFLQLHLWVYAVLAVELVRPGLLATCVVAVLTRLTSRPKRGRKERRSLPLPGIAVLAVLLAALGGILWMRLLQGFVTRESMQEALVFVLRYGVMPVAAFAVLSCAGRARAN